MKQRCRFGIKTNSWIFPNAAIFIVRMDTTQFSKLLAAVEQLKAVLPADIASKIVCEVSG